MKKLTVVVLTLIILLSLGIEGCNHGGKEPTPTPLENAFEWINEDAIEGGYYNLAAVRDDADLLKEYESFANDTYAQEEFRDFGIDSSKIDYVVYQAMDFQTSSLVLGRFDLDNIRESLERLGFTKGTYENTEFWEGNYTTYDGTGFAFMPGKIIWGHKELVRSFVSTVKGLENSIYDLTETKEVLDRLPDWTPIAVDVTFNVLNEYGISYASIAARAMAKKDVDTMNIANVIKFIDSTTANQMCEYIMSGSNTQVICDGEYVIIEFEMPIQ